VTIPGVVFLIAALVCLVSGIGLLWAFIYGLIAGLLAWLGLAIFSRSRM
jgi:hypothetical protein